MESLEAVVDDDLSEVAGRVSLQTVVQQQSNRSDASVQCGEMSRVQHARYDVTGQRRTHSH